MNELVIELNRIYHAVEAPQYDATHPEIHAQLPPVWRELLGRAAAKIEGPLKVLDFGSGTGFEAEQIVRALPRTRLAGLHCYDIAPEMLERCRSRIAPLFSTATFSTDLESIEGSFNVLVTNAVLHHIPDALLALQRLEPKLSKACLWVSGHEPSNRFYMNPECLSAYRKFKREDRWRRFLSPKRYCAKIANILRVDGDPAHKTAEIAYRRGLFKKRPPPALVSALVDFHVADSEDEASRGQGFDLRDLSVELKGEWNLLWSCSYSFLGPYFEGKLPRKWARVAEDLARRFPEDGANWSAVWERALPTSV